MSVCVSIFRFREEQCDPSMTYLQQTCCVMLPCVQSQLIECAASCNQQHAFDLAPLALFAIILVSGGITSDISSQQQSVVLSRLPY